ncbi:hypothetical protein [Nocardioides terrisoli]|uniref:hypothetical protein n=1 Tax=Nocardioides terrisoli TaxID=3388267 RepID=UPI00287B5EBA|nr:hypothetical protein [Nocardioides marmorisolisilvae]
MRKIRVVATVGALACTASMLQTAAYGTVVADSPACRPTIPSTTSVRAQPDHVVVARRGHRVPGAYVRVRLVPYGSSSSTHPPVIAEGFTDARGVFGFDLADHVKARRMARRAAGHAVNLQLSALTARGARVGAGNEVWSLHGRHRARLPLRYAVPAARRTAPDSSARLAMTSTAVDRDLAGVPADARSMVPGNYTKHTASTTRMVKMAILHSSRGTNVKFTMAKGRDTRVQIAFSYDGGAWKVNGWAEESTARESTHSRTFDGVFNRVMLAKYVFHKYHHYELDCIPCGSCSQWTSDYWKPYSWTGGLTYGSTRQSQPSSIPSTHIGLARRNDTFSTSTAKNHEFGAGVELAGLALNAQTGYSSRTSIEWSANGHCGRNYLAGSGGKYPVSARVIYAYSRRC